MRHSSGLKSLETEIGKQGIYVTKREAVVGGT